MPTASTDTLTDAGIALGYNGGLTLSMSVSDLQRSVAWYRDVLGFKVQYVMDEMGWCELTTGTGGVNVGLSQVESPKIGGPTPTWGVNDIDAARATLESKGVRFDGPTREIEGMVKLAGFFDPDGNSLMLYQSLGE